MYSYSEMVNILLKEFPEISEQYAEDIAWLKDTFQNQESKGQTSYFDHCFCDYIGHLLADKQQDNLKIEKIFAFLENMATSRDSDVRNLLQVTVLEYLRSWSLFQSKSEKFMLPETKKMFDYVSPTRRSWGWKLGRGLRDIISPRPEIAPMPLAIISVPAASR